MRAKPLLISFVLAVPLCLPPDGAGGVSLNFRDADLRSVIETIAQFSATNIIIDPRVSGTVTVVSPVDVADDQLMPVLDSILSVYGFALVPAGDGVLKVVPDERAHGEAPLTAAATGRSRDRIVTRIFPIRHLTASALVPTLKETLPANAVLAANDAANALILSSAAGTVERVAAMIATLDRPALESTIVMPLRHASASEVVRILATILTVPGRPNPAAAPAPRVVADARTNSIVVTAADRAQRERILEIIDDLDQPPATGGGTEVIYLRYGRAENIAGLLQAVAKQLGAASADDGSVVQADPQTNALVITGSPDVVGALRSVVSRLDIRRAQVMVEAVIAEVSDDTARDLGIQFSVSDGNVGASLSSGPRGLNLSGVPFTTLPAVTGATLALGSLGRSVPNLGAVVRALRADSASNILSTPTLSTLDNEEAEIVVGQDVPFVTGQYTTTGTSNQVTPFQTIERRAVGLRLRILPQINEGGVVRLEIFQEVSSINPVNVGAVDLITDRRSISTTALVPSGQMVVIGGLIDDVVRGSVEKVPGLAEIPVLGELFTTRSKSSTQRNLMIFIRPEILDSDAVTADIAHTKYNMLRGLQAQMYVGSGGRLAGTAILPPAPY